jgi:hypothetical protein
MKRPLYVVVLCLAVFLIAALLSPAIAREVETTLDVPGTAHVRATTSGCSNNPGPYITLGGELELGEVRGRLIFRNNVRGTHEHEEIINDVVLVIRGEEIKFPKQPPLGGAGGNPWIYFQLFDDQWEPLSDEMLLGRCVQGLNPLAFPLMLGAESTVDITSDSCRNSPGPYITLEGEIVLGSLNGKLIFRNNQRGTHEYEEYVGFDLTLLPAGEVLQFAKQPPQGGAGGNPLVYFQFVDGDGEPLSGEMFVGRCNKL